MSTGLRSRVIRPTSTSGRGRPGADHGLRGQRSEPGVSGFGAGVGPFLLGTGVTFLRGGDLRSSKQHQTAGLPILRTRLAPYLVSRRHMDLMIYAAHPRLSAHLRATLQPTPRLMNPRYSGGLSVTACAKTVRAGRGRGPARRPRCGCARRAFRTGAACASGPCSPTLTAGRRSPARTR